MNSKLALPLLFLCLLAVAGCNRQGLEVPTDVEDDASQQQDTNDAAEPVVVNPDAAKVGTEVDGIGDIAAQAYQFEAGQTVFISVPTKFGRMPGDRLEIFWFHDDGRSRKDDTKKIEGPFTVFEFAPTDPGPYNVEIAANNQPIALVQFTVR